MAGFNTRRPSADVSCRRGTGRSHALDVDQLPRRGSDYGSIGQATEPQHRQMTMVDRMPKHLAILACAGFLLAGGTAAGAPSCRFVSSWHLSSGQERTDLVAGGAASEDYVVASDKGTVLVVFK